MLATRFAVWVVAFTTVLSRGFTVCFVVVFEVTRCCGCVAVLVFLLVEFWMLSARLVADVTVRPDACCEEIAVVVLRFDAARTVFASSAIVVWDTDKPRHTVKNSIILFIP